MALIHSPKESSCWKMMLLRPPDFQGVAMSKKTPSLFMSFQLSLGSSFQNLISSNSIPSSWISKNMAYLAHSQADEIKSHLQKYMLHIRRVLPGSLTATSPSQNYLWQTLEDPSKANNTSSSQSGSPDGPFHLGESSKGVSITCDRIIFSVGIPGWTFHLGESSKGVSITCDCISIDDDVGLF